ncbi:MAG: hypothetical protein K6F71_00700 [Ruminococcus sp.]|uniref:hypothetical protein n=1 Tax=Ruminococcus sp. TaxID=41978 RepID=UPI0025D950A4|nr:hypothetical protein [Ruminococcus sp.]MCR5539343.1 hypothetical protein [Ruminococcus sp.]
MVENVNTKKAAIKKSNGCLTAVIIVVVLILGFIGFIIYTMIDFRNKHHINWDTFNDKRIATVEKYLDMTMPDDVTPVWFRHASFLDSDTKLIVKGIADPQDFLGKAFPDSEITEYTTDEEDITKNEVSSPGNEKKNELQRISPDSELFSSFKDDLNFAIKGKGYSIEFTEIYDRLIADGKDSMYQYYIGFGKTDSGYCAVIRFLTY